MLDHFRVVTKDNHQCEGMGLNPAFVSTVYIFRILTVPCVHSDCRPHIGYNKSPRSPKPLPSALMRDKHCLKAIPTTTNVGTRHYKLFCYSGSFCDSRRPARCLAEPLVPHGMGTPQRDLGAGGDSGDGLASLEDVLTSLSGAEVGSAEASTQLSPRSPGFL